jgi:diguanylate cyclase (GGDEF)-like protein/PAS domain S-box-containing protein
VQPDVATASDFHKQLLDNLSDGVYFVDGERTITYWNRGAEHLTGYPACDVVGRRCFDDILNHVDAEGEGLCTGSCPLAATIEDGADRQVEVWLRHRDGSRRPVRVRTSPIRDADGAITGAVEVFDDASLLVAARRQADAARRDALVDELTGLPNRRFFNMMLAARAEDLERYRTPFTVLIADADHFKAINDSLGHTVGDDLLRAIGATLQGAIREGDFVARWGGEEFAVLAQHVTPAATRELAERLRLLVAATVVRTGTRPCSATISIGAAIATSGEATIDTLVRADRALYAAKTAGRNRVMIDA